MSVALASLRFPISYVQLVEQIVAYEGLNFDWVLSKTLKIDQLAMDDPNTLIDGVQFGKILGVISDFVNKNPEGQSQLIKFFPPTTHGYVGLVALTSASIGKAIELTERYCYQVMPAFEVSHEIEQGVFSVIFKPVADFAEHNDLLLELVIYAWKSILAYSDIPMDQLTITFSHKTLRLSDFHLFHPSSSLILAGGVNSLSFPAALSTLPISTANNTTMKLMEKELEHKKVILNRLSTFSYKISLMINERMREDISVDLADVAAVLNISIRTLSRRLKEEDTSFKALHNECRLELAKTLLTESSKSIGQISFALGFLNEASFSRYFKQQTDKSPIQYRDHSC